MHDIHPTDHYNPDHLHACHRLDANLPELPRAEPEPGRLVHHEGLVARGEGAQTTGAHVKCPGHTPRLKRSDNVLLRENQKIFHLSASVKLKDYFEPWEKSFEFNNRPEIRHIMFY